MAKQAAPLSEDELACVYSAAILADDDIPVTEDKIKAILKAANVSVEAIWPSLFARALGGMNVKELIHNIAAAPAAGEAAAAPAGGASSAAESKPAETKKEPEPESDSDDDMGFGLFD